MEGERARGTTTSRESRGVTAYYIGRPALERFYHLHWFFVCFFSRSLRVWGNEFELLFLLSRGAKEGPMRILSWKVESGATDISCQRRMMVTLLLAGRGPEGEH